MPVYFLLVPVSMVASRAISRQFSPALIFRRAGRRRDRQQAAALAGKAVDLSQALPRSLYRELAARLTEVAGDERRRLVAELSTYTAGGPAQVQSAVAIPGTEHSLRLVFLDGWQLVVSGMQASSARQILAAARRGMRLTGVDVVEGFSFRVRVRWTANEGPGQALVALASLRGPFPTQQPRR